MIHIIESENEAGSDTEAVRLLSLVEKIFSHDGFLREILGFEHRSEQAQMAHEFSKSLLSRKHLIFEAGTGVGKSLAYLIPSILYSQMTKRKCVVATNTISLQEQLLDKDVPAVRDLFLKSAGLEAFSEFNCALLVGRANYLCQNRLNRALLGQKDLFETHQRDELQRIADWVAMGPIEGIRQEMLPSPNPLVWDLVNADSSVCSSKRCTPDTCFYRKARSLVESADLVIINHSLLFSLIGAGGGQGDESAGILFPDDFLIFDEAHEITDVASEHLGVSLSSWALETFLNNFTTRNEERGCYPKLPGILTWMLWKMPLSL